LRDGGSTPSILLKERGLSDETAFSFEAVCVIASTKCTQCASPLIVRTDGRVIGDPGCAGTPRGDASDNELVGVKLLTLPADLVTGDSYLRRLGFEVNVSCYGSQATRLLDEKKSQHPAFAALHVFGCDVSPLLAGAVSVPAHRGWQPTESRQHGTIWELPLRSGPAVQRPNQIHPRQKRNTAALQSAGGALCRARLPLPPPIGLVNSVLPFEFGSDAFSEPKQKKSR
jgi:hypothetical protein